MPLAYYARSATAAFWSEHWGGHSVEELLRVARTSPLTRLIERHLPRDGRVLEAGCGVGQYVLLLRERGHAIVGVDWSLEALGQGARAGAPLAAMDLRSLAVRDRSVRAYLSLGVVEHDPDGPGPILGEAARVLVPGGVLLLSVPYLNGARRLLAPYLRSQSRQLSAAGGQFYQFAFTRGEVRAFLEAGGFAIRSFHPYDPARVLRQAVRRLVGGSAARAGGEGESALSARRADPRAGRHTAGGGFPGRRGPGGGLINAARRLLYTDPALRLLGHMLLAVAVRR